MKHFRHILIGTLLLLTSCIENSIPYPVVTLQILGVEGEGFTCSPEDINTQERIVTLHLDEQTDISNVKIDKISVTENARSSKPLSGTFDLRTPLYLTLSFYQDYEWTIVADQQIERYFEVESQIGAAEIDVDQLTAKAYVPEGTDLSDLKVTRLKLGPADITTMTPPIDELTSFESVRYVYVAYHDFEEKWSLYVEATDTKVRFTQVDAWSGVIWAYAEGNSADELGFRYRKTGDEAWTEVDKDANQHLGGAFDTSYHGTYPGTQYEVVAYSGSNETEVASVTTEAAPQLPTEVSKSGKRSTKSSIPTWPTAFTSGIQATKRQHRQRYSDRQDDGRASRHIGHLCRTAFVEARRSGRRLQIGRRNLFTGIFYGIRNLTHGIVCFGQPFEARPTALHGWFKYNQGMLTNVGSTQPPGDEPQGRRSRQRHDLHRVGTWTPEEYGISQGEQFGSAETRLRSTPATPVRSSIRPSPAVIGYGQLPLTASYSEWQEFTIPLKYVATDRKPTHIVVVCSASRWGDYFIGSTSSVLVVDDLELISTGWTKPVNRYIPPSDYPSDRIRTTKTQNAESAALSNKKAGNHSLLFCSVIGLTLSAPSGSELRDPAILIITIHYVLHESPRLTVAGKFAALHDLVLVIGGIGLEFQVAEHHLPGIGVFAVHTGQPPGIIDMTDSTVVAGQDQAHSVFSEIPAAGRASNRSDSTLYWPAIHWFPDRARLLPRLRRTAGPLQA